VIESEIALSERDDPQNFIRATTKSPSLCVDFGLGNIWQFSNGIYIGAEWIGISAPISSSSSSNTETGGTANADLEDAAKDTEKLAKDLGEANTLHLLVLNLGYAF
jgi:hypothetical protein